MLYIKQAMKRIICLTALCFAILQGKAQEDHLNRGHNFGYQLSQYQQDFGFGLNYGTPLLFKSFGFRAKYNLMFHQHIAGSLSTWSPYSNFSLGLTGFGGQVGSHIRIYGEGGLLLILPSSAFSSRSTQFGGYGLFGFEFFNSSGFNYFIEMGGVGTGATADKLPYQPIYSNGLSLSTGFRIVLP